MSDDRRATQQVHVLTQHLQLLAKVLVAVLSSNAAHTCLISCCGVLVQVREVLQTSESDGDIQHPTSQRAFLPPWQTTPDDGHRTLCKHPAKYEKQSRCATYRLVAGGGLQHGQGIALQATLNTVAQYLQKQRNISRLYDK